MVNAYNDGKGISVGRTKPESLINDKCMKYIGSLINDKCMASI